MSECKLRYTLSERPAQAPEGWRIFNAPRPLYGTLRSVDGQVAPETWDGDFLHGTIYAAVDPEDPNAPMWVGNNGLADAQEIQYITKQQAFDVSLRWSQASDYAAEIAEVDLTEDNRWDMIDKGMRLLNDGEVTL